MLIKPASVRAGGGELYLERKNQKDKILQGKVIDGYIKSKISCPTTKQGMSDYARTRPQKLY